MNITYNLQFNDDIKIFTDSDLDGTGCRIFFEYYLKQYNFLIKQSSIGEVDGEFTEIYQYNDCVVIFADLVPTLETYIKLKQVAKAIFIFDHHKTSYLRLKDTVIENYIYDQELCSAYLVYEFFSKGKRYNKCADELSKLINIYDTFRENEELFFTSLGLNAMLWKEVMDKNHKYISNTYGYDMFVNRNLKKVITFRDEGFVFFDNEKKYIKTNEEKIKKMLEKAEKDMIINYDSENRKYCYFELSSKISIIASLILSKYKEIDYVLAHNTFKVEGRPENVKKFSLRTRRENLDLSKMAEYLNKLGEGPGQGGGHEMAAGFVITDIELHEKFKNGGLVYETNLQAV